MCIGRNIYMGGTVFSQNEPFAFRSFKPVNYFSRDNSKIKLINFVFHNKCRIHRKLLFIVNTGFFIISFFFSIKNPHEFYFIE